ncbi:MAG: pantoate--beta-alanine ligase [Nitrospirae bacterium]|nr:pantoate--beta-alanine ligase [Nitrospirota bacterium]
MEVIRIPRIMQDTSRGHLLHSRTLGFVPTMGALHEGHMSLMRMSKEENSVTAASIFVNPTQFGPSEDFASYPRKMEADIAKLREADIDILFLPDVSLMYPEGFATLVEVTGLSEKMCGHFRPGHFRGVTTVVAKLLTIVRPSRAYFGQKDFQQTVVIKRMAKDLNLDTEIVVCPTIREYDGLAMSSRNTYLSGEQRAAATVLYRSLCRASDAIKAGTRSGAAVRDMLQQDLSREPLITGIDYASVFIPETLDEADEITGEVVLAIAARMGSTRLIDNMLVVPSFSH